jgi:hypothetical protein
MKVQMDCIGAIVYHIKEIFNEPNLDTVIRLIRLQWVGHIQRMQDKINKKKGENECNL